MAKKTPYDNNNAIGKTAAPPTIDEGGIYNPVGTGTSGNAPTEPILTNNPTPYVQPTPTVIPTQPVQPTPPIINPLNPPIYPNVQVNEGPITTAPTPPVTPIRTPIKPTTPTPPISPIAPVVTTETPATPVIVQPTTTVQPTGSNNISSNKNYLYIGAGLLLILLLFKSNKK